MATTIKKIAESLGLSAPTVSHILNNRGRFRDETRQRVFKAARQFGYMPNGAARSMRSQRSLQVGALIRNNPEQRFRNIAAYETILGINEGLEQAGYLLSLIRIGDVAVQGPESRALRERMFDGMIIVSAVPDDVLERVGQLTAHSVWVDNDIWRPTGAIRRDEQFAGSVATQALINLGYRQIVWFGPPPDSSHEMHYSERDRRAGVEASAKKADIAVSLLVEPRGSLAQQPDMLARWLRPEIGIVAYSTPYARWLSHAASSLNLQPGYDFGLVCCDDSHDSSAQWPGLSRVSFDRFQMGLNAARMVIDQIQGRECPSQMLRGHWIPGNTAWGPERFQVLVG